MSVKLAMVGIGRTIVSLGLQVDIRLTSVRLQQFWFTQTPVSVYVGTSLPSSVIVMRTSIRSLAPQVKHLPFFLGTSSKYISSAIFRFIIA